LEYEKKKPGRGGIENARSAYCPPREKRAPTFVLCPREKKGLLCGLVDEAKKGEKKRAFGYRENGRGKEPWYAIGRTASLAKKKMIQLRKGKEVLSASG